MSIIAFTKVTLPHGWLGNMAPFPIAHEGRIYRTTEALFQALRFDEDAIREAIRSERSPMAAKMRAKIQRDRMVVVPQSPQDVANMAMVLRLKLDTHPRLRAMLAETGDATLIEDCSKRAHGSGLFWGAALVDGEWQGANVLGKLWMEIRDRTDGTR
jgi:ribA/ribD-fused uncharacterized protein